MALVMPSSACSSGVGGIFAAKRHVLAVLYVIRGAHRINRVSYVHQITKLQVRKLEKPEYIGYVRVKLDQIAGCQSLHGFFL